MSLTCPYQLSKGIPGIVKHRRDPQHGRLEVLSRLRLQKRKIRILFLCIHNMSIFIIYQKGDRHGLNQGMIATYYIKSGIRYR